MGPAAPLPSASDFPSELSAVLHLPASAQPTNAMLFLAGLGDTAANFSSFARALNLPDTLCITLSPPFPLPAALGLPATTRSWSEDLHLDPTGAIDPDMPLDRAVNLLADNVLLPLRDSFHFAPSAIHLLGFAQGGALALALALHPSLAATSLGSVTSVGGALPLSLGLEQPRPAQSRTPVLLLSGTRNALAATGSSQLRRVRDAFEFVQYEPWGRGDDGMPRNREEVLPMMRFWGQRLRSRRGVPEGSMEVG